MVIMGLNIGIRQCCNAAMIHASTGVNVLCHQTCVLRPKRKNLLFVLSDLPGKNTPGLECFFDPAGLECFSDVLVRSGNLFFQFRFFSARYYINVAHKLFTTTICWSKLWRGHKLYMYPCWRTWQILCSRYLTSHRLHLTQRITDVWWLWRYKDGVYATLFHIRLLFWLK